VEVIRAELSRVYTERRVATPPRTNSATIVDELAGELTSFWELVLAPVWPRVLACLESEVVYRSRVLAFAGAPAVLEGLHADVRFSSTRGGGGILRVRAGGGALRRAAPDGLLLVPSVFSWPDVYAVAREPWRPTITYPAQGVAELWFDPGKRRAPGDAPLVALAGSARARVLRLLVRPRTTLELATSLRSAPATVSEHLGRLRAAGIVDRARSGRRVVYSLSERGHAIIRAAEA
jgi:DNA-binding transcriptional ArsR family regulator